jgi:A/G-specific adenine glycosylase
MLQQTQVNRVEPKYLEFMERWKTPQALADSRFSDLLKFWQGLGYPRRARNLYDAAAQIDKFHDGKVPSTIEELLLLPGIGPYTARAVMVFAFEARVGVLDTNVGRLLARWSGYPLQVKEAQQIADELVDPERPWLWNQGLFDLAATRCTKQNPRCSGCPVEKWCSWRGVGGDPSLGSAGVTAKQRRFQDSDRQARGRLLKALTARPVPISEAAAAMGLVDDQARASRLITDLQGERLLTIQREVLLLGDLLQ